jgi:hypothetical protein
MCVHVPLLRVQRDIRWYVMLGPDPGPWAQVHEYALAPTSIYIYIYIYIYIRLYIYIYSAIVPAFFPLIKYGSGGKNTIVGSLTTDVEARTPLSNTDCLRAI